MIRRRCSSIRHLSPWTSRSRLTPRGGIRKTKTFRRMWILQVTTPNSNHQYSKRTHQLVLQVLGYFLVLHLMNCIPSMVPTYERMSTRPSSKWWYPYILWFSKQVVLIWWSDYHSVMPTMFIDRQDCNLIKRLTFSNRDGNLCI